MAGPQAQRPISHTEGASAIRGLRTADLSQMEIDVDTNSNKEDVENGGGQTKRVRHRHRPLYRRLFNYLKTAWTGVNFSSGSGKYNFIHYSKCLFFIHFNRFFYFFVFFSPLRNFEIL